MVRLARSLGRAALIAFALKIRERGPTPRKLAKVMTAAKKKSFFDGAVYFHSDLRESRFTQAHATKAGYTPRKRSYLVQKLRKFGHTRPLEYSGQARKASRVANITSTSRGFRIRYPGVRAFNYLNKHTQVNMVTEFTTVLPDEVNKVAEHIDRTLDQALNSQGETTVTTLS